VLLLTGCAAIEEGIEFATAEATVAAAAAEIATHAMESPAVASVSSDYSVSQLTLVVIVELEPSAANGEALLAVTAVMSGVRADVFDGVTRDVLIRRGGSTLAVASPSLELVDAQEVEGWLLVGELVPLVIELTGSGSGGQAARRVVAAGLDEIPGSDAAESIDATSLDEVAELRAVVAALLAAPWSREVDESWLLPGLQRVGDDATPDTLTDLLAALPSDLTLAVPDEGGVRPGLAILLTPAVTSLVWYSDGPALDAAPDWLATIDAFTAGVEALPDGSELGYFSPQLQASATVGTCPSSTSGQAVESDRAFAAALAKAGVAGVTAGVCR